jgi:hypothetical protein
VVRGCLYGKLLILRGMLWLKMVMRRRDLIVRWSQMPVYMREGIEVQVFEGN